jgi:ADP-heptose:LPS heptosyltransferase
MEKICVIKLGALGDFVLSTAAFADIRAHHPNDHITLITTKKMAPLTKNIPFFDDIAWDDRKPFWHLPYLVDIHKKLSGFDKVYDLQTNQRSGLYFLLAGKPQWNGIVKGCAVPHDNPNRNNMHSLERIAEQLQNSGIFAQNATNIAYAAEDAGDILSRHNVPNSFVAIVPGGSKHRPGKRWPHFVALIHILEEQGKTAVLLGGPDEADLLTEIAEQTKAINLCGEANLNQLIDILNKAEMIVGNDTGPMHIAAALHKKGITLFGPESNPALCAPKSPNMHILQNQDFASISPQQVLDVLQ